MFTFEGIGIVLPLENKMKNPSRMKGWTGVLNTGMVFVACLYVAVGFYGYLRYGEAVYGQGSITLNLPNEMYVSEKTTKGRTFLELGKQTMSSKNFPG